MNKYEKYTYDQLIKIMYEKGRKSDLGRLYFLSGFYDAIYDKHSLATREISRWPEDIPIEHRIVYIVYMTGGCTAGRGLGAWLTEDIDHQSYATALREIGLDDLGGVVDEMLRLMPEELLGERDGSGEEPLERFFKGDLDSVIEPMEDILSESEDKIRRYLAEYVWIHKDSYRELLPEIQYWYDSYEKDSQ